MNGISSLVHLNQCFSSNIAIHASFLPCGLGLSWFWSFHLPIINGEPRWANDDWTHLLQKKFLSRLSHCGHCGNATILNPYTYNKTKEASFYFCWKCFLTCSHLVPLLDKICVDYHCFSFVTWCTLTRIEVEPMLALSISRAIFLTTRSDDFVQPVNNWGTQKLSISRFKIGIHLEMHHSNAFRMKITSISSTDHIWPPTSNTHRPVPYLFSNQTYNVYPLKMFKGLNVHPYTQYLRASPSLKPCSQTFIFMHYVVWRRKM